MNIADKLQQLAEMHRRGELTDAEFTQAKQATLNAPPELSGGRPTEPSTRWQNSSSNLGDNIREGVNAWIKYRIVMAVIGAIMFILMAMLMFGMFHSSTSPITIGPPVFRPGFLPGH